MKKSRRSLLIILCGLGFSAVQPAVAQAPLCSQALLQPPSPGPIDVAIEAFARLTRHIDLIQASGQNDAHYKSLRLSQKDKEQELLRILNLTSQEFRQLIREKNLSLQGKSEAAKTKVAQDKILFYNVAKTFDIETGSIPTSISADGKYFATIRKEFVDFFSTESGKTKTFSVFNGSELKDSIFAATYNMGNIEFHTISYKETKVHVEPKQKQFANHHSKLSFDKSILVHYKTFDWAEGTTLFYEKFDSFGKRILTDSVNIPIHGSLVTVEYVDNTRWILKLRQSLFTFTLHDKKLTPLNLEGNVVRAFPDHVVIASADHEISILNLNTLKYESRKFDSSKEVVLATKDFIWIKDEWLDSNESGALRLISVTDINKDLGVWNVGHNFEMKEMPGTDFVFVFAKSHNSPVKTGIYYNNDLSQPFYHFDHYSDSQRAIHRVWPTEDGKQLVITGTDRSSGQEKGFIDVLERTYGK